jgi:hypothetical protein
MADPVRCQVIDQHLRRPPQGAWPRRKRKQGDLFRLLEQRHRVMDGAQGLALGFQAMTTLSPTGRASSPAAGSASEPGFEQCPAERAGANGVMGQAFGRAQSSSRRTGRRVRLYLLVRRHEDGRRRRLSSSSIPRNCKHRIMAEMDDTKRHQATISWNGVHQGAAMRTSLRSTGVSSMVIGRPLASTMAWIFANRFLTFRSPRHHRGAKRNEGEEPRLGVGRAAQPGDLACRRAVRGVGADPSSPDDEGEGRRDRDQGDRGEQRYLRPKEPIGKIIGRLWRRRTSAWAPRRAKRRRGDESWTLLRTSRFSAAPDSLAFAERETNRCAASLGFSMSTSVCSG